jgi:transcription termination/antitermination protein NusG
MSLQDFKHWYAVSINMNKEKATKAELISRRALFNDKNLLDVEYLQKKELVVDKGGKRKVKNKLLMSGYLLVKVKPSLDEDELGNIKESFPAETFDLILGTPGVKFFVNCNQKKPIAFKPREIKRLFDMCDDAHLEVKQNVLNDYEVGDILDVIDGPFAGYKCEVVSVQGNKILGQLDMFGRVVPAEFSKEQVYKK